MKTLIDVEIKLKDSLFSEPTKCKLIEVDDDETLNYNELNLKPVGIYTGQKTITEFLNNNLSHTDMKYILTLLQFVNKYLQNEYGDTMSNKYIIIGDKITSFGWRGFGYIKYLAKIFNTEDIVDYMEGYMNITDEDIKRTLNTKMSGEQTHILEYNDKYKVIITRTNSKTFYDKYRVEIIPYETKECHGDLDVSIFIGYDVWYVPYTNKITKLEYTCSKEELEEITEKKCDELYEKAKEVVNILDER